MLIRQQSLKLLNDNTIKIALGLVLVATFAFSFGQLPWYTFAHPAPLGAQAGGLSLYILSVGVFLVAAHQINDIRWIKWIVWSFLAVGSISIGIFIPGIGQLIDRILTVQARGSMLYTWFAVLAFGQALFNNRLHSWFRIVLGAFVVALLLSVVYYLQDWKSGWVPPLVAVSVLFVLWSYRLIFLGVIPAVMLLPKLVSKLIEADAYSYSTRIEAWAIVIDIAKINPILGVGPANYYWYAPLFAMRGYRTILSSHNQYIDLIGQTGLLGLAVFLWFFLEIGFYGWRLRKQISDGFSKAYVNSVLAGLVGTLVAAAFGDWVIPFFYNINIGGFRASMLPWLFFGALVALGQLYTNQNTEPKVNL